MIIHFKTVTKYTSNILMVQMDLKDKQILGSQQTEISFIPRELGTRAHSKLVQLNALNLNYKFISLLYFKNKQ
jgi:hypothetical protein